MAFVEQTEGVGVTAFILLEQFLVGLRGRRAVVSVTLHHTAPPSGSTYLSNRQPLTRRFRRKGGYGQFATCAFSDDSDGLIVGDTKTG
jgi:hypothetical protein